MKRWFVYENGLWVDTIDCLWYLDAAGAKTVAVDWFGHDKNVVLIKKG